MDARIDWIWLQQALGPGNGKTGRLLSHFRSASAVWEASPEQWLQAGLSAAEQDRLAKRDRDSARRLLDAVLSAGDWVLTPEDAYYPSLLLGLPDFPLALYGRGEPPDLEHWPAVGMVGTRKCSDEGRRVAGDIARELALHGVVVVSGGAEGIDAASHWGALYAGGLTVAVQACGLDVDYPALNREMRLRILNGRGALLSEYPYGSPPLRHHFPVRNRLIGGLSLGVCVVEAPRHSGSLITARLAAEQGRDVFVVPGAWNSVRFNGSNSLIKQGARLITSPQEILEEYEARFPSILERREPAAASVPVSKRARPEAKEPEDPVSAETADCPAGAGETARRVWEALNAGCPGEPDELAKASGLTAPQVLAALTELELLGGVLAGPGGRYRLPAGPAHSGVI